MFRFILLLVLLSILPALAAQISYGVYGSPQVPANSVAQGRTDYTALAFGAASFSGSVDFTACTIDNVSTTNPAGSTDTMRIRLIRDSFPYNLSYDAGDTVLDTVNSPTFPVIFSGFTETLPTTSTVNPWPFFVAIDVAGVGTSTVGNIYQLAITSFTATGISLTSLPITGNYHDIVAPTNAEMDLQRVATSIPAGGTDSVGNRAAGTQFNLDYTIYNTGADPLTLTGSPLVEIISLSVINCAASVAVLPSTPVAANTGSTTFQIQVTPTTAGQQFGFGFIINNNDNDENPYNIAVLGDATVSGSTATQLAIRTQPAGAVENVAFVTQPVIEIQDATGAVVTSDSSTQVNVAYATGGPSGNIIGTYPVTAVNGVVTFTDLGIDTAQQGVTLNFFDTNALLTSVISNSFDVAGTPTQLGVTTQPGGAAPGAAFTQQPVVEIQDASGVRVATDNTTQVTVSITSGTGDPAGVLSGTLTRTAVNGVVTFTDLSIDLEGSAYTLDFVDSGATLTPAVSSPFDVTTGGGGSGGGGGGSDGGGGCVTTHGTHYGWLVLALLAGLIVASRLWFTPVGNLGKIA